MCKLLSKLKFLQFVGLEPVSDTMPKGKDISNCPKKTIVHVHQSGKDYKTISKHPVFYCSLVTRSIQEWVGKVKPMLKEIQLPTTVELLKKKKKTFKVLEWLSQSPDLLEMLRKN